MNTLKTKKWLSKKKRFTRKIFIIIQYKSLFREGRAFYFNTLASG